MSKEKKSHRAESFGSQMWTPASRVALTLAAVAAATGCSSAGGRGAEAAGSTNEAVSNVAFNELVAAVGNGGNIQVVGVGASLPLPFEQGAPYLDDWQNNATSGWNAGGVLATSAPALSSIAMAPGAGPTPTLQVVGIASSTGYPYAVSYQDSGGGWHAAGASPLSTVGLSSVVAAPGTGYTPTLQVVGLADGAPYLGGWQDDAGHWHGGFALPSAPATFATLVTGAGAGSTPSLQIVGLDATYGHAYVASYQDDTGAWHGGAELPAQSTPWKAIAAAPGTGYTPTLQVIGLGASNGFAYLVAWQDDTGAWHGGFELPGQTTPLFSVTLGAGTDTSGNPSLQVLGLTMSGQPYLAAWQTDTGTWEANAGIQASVSAACAIPGVIATELLAIRGNGALQVIAYSPQTDRTYLACYQTSGVWHSGQSVSPLP